MGKNSELPHISELAHPVCRNPYTRPGKYGVCVLQLGELGDEWGEKTQHSNLRQARQQAGAWPFMGQVPRLVVEWASGKIVYGPRRMTASGMRPAHEFMGQKIWREELDKFPQGEE